MVESLRSADISWPMNDGGNQVSAGPSAMEFLADHWLPRGPQEDSQVAIGNSKSVCGRYAQHQQNLTQLNPS